MSSSRIDRWTFSAAFTALELKEVAWTEKKLGRGSDASVFEVTWGGTTCAGKRLHEILLEDDSPGGARRFVQNFEQECLTWSKLNHPRVVQFLGVHFHSASRIPMLILEKMDVSLCQFLDTHEREHTPLPDKVFILRQTAQALVYLHSCAPPLVHHDLSTNNILLCESSLVTKVTDFGMSRALDHSKLTRKSSVKGTTAFMPPEALTSPPKYDEKLDSFSYGNVTIATLTHQWPQPSYPTVCEGDRIVGQSELQRREHYIKLLTREETDMFLPSIRSCLDNRSSQRPSSSELVEVMKSIEEAHPWTQTRDIINLQKDLVAKTELLQQKDTQLQQKDAQLQDQVAECKQVEIQLLQKEATIQFATSQLEQKDAMLQQKDADLQRQNVKLQQKDAQLQQKDADLQQQNVKLQQKDAQIQQKDAQLQQKNAEIQQRDAIRTELQEKDALLIQKDADILQKNAQLQVKDAELNALRQQLQTALDTNDSCFAQNTQPQNGQLLQKDTQLQADKQWRKIQYLSVLVCGAYCYGVATKGDLIAIGVEKAIRFYNKSKNELFDGFDAHGRRLGYNLGLAFLDDTSLIVSDSDNNSLSLCSTAGKVLWSVSFDCTRFKPLGIATSSEGQIFVCDGATHSISVFDSHGKLLSKFGSYGTGDGQFNIPRDLCFSSEGLIYVTDNGNRRICVHNQSGEFLRQFSCGDHKPTCISATNRGHFVVTFSQDDSVVVCTSEGDCVQRIGSHGKMPGQFDRPHGVTVDSEDGLIYIADCRNKRLQVYTCTE